MLRLLVLLHFLTSLVFASPTKRTSGPFLVWAPPTDYPSPGVEYARHIRLSDGVTLLSTFADFSPSSAGLQHFPVWKSTNEGASWTKIGQVNDTQNGIGLTFEPAMLQLNNAYGAYPAGTILVAGNSANFSGTATYSTQIDLYASSDLGRTWSFVSHVTPRAGGNAGVVDPTPVWEPFILEYGGEVHIFYSDERDPLYNQKISVQSSVDLLSWGPQTNVVLGPDSNARPGMPIISQFPGGWFLSFELCNAPTPEPSCAASYRVANSPLSFDGQTTHQVIGTDGSQPTSSPYNVWTPYGGPNGSLVINSFSQASLYINTQLGVGRWTRISSPVIAAYSRSLQVAPNTRDITINSGGPFRGTHNNVTFGSQTLP